MGVSGQGVRVERRDARRLKSEEKEKVKEFAPFWTAGKPDPSTLNYAATFVRGNEPPLLTLVMRPRLPRVEAAQDVELTVGQYQAAWRATATLTAPEGDLAVMEWRIDSPRPLTLTGVAGPQECERTARMCHVCPRACHTRPHGACAATERPAAVRGTRR